MGNIWMTVRSGGEFLHERTFTCLINYDRVSSFVASEEGRMTQIQLWKELSEKLERIQPGIMRNI